MKTSKTIAGATTTYTSLRQLFRAVNRRRKGIIIDCNQTDDHGGEIQIRDSDGAVWSSSWGSHELMVRSFSPRVSNPAALNRK